MIINVLKNSKIKILSLLSVKSFFPLTCQFSIKCTKRRTIITCQHILVTVKLALLKFTLGVAGVNKPQEERCFQEVLKYMKPNAVMLELGSYWGFYSMWFYKEVKNPVCCLIEPNFTGLNYRKQNLEMNQMHGNFFQAFVSSSSGISKDGVKIICIDDFVAEQNIQYIDILHSDIQGFEVEMLEGARTTITEDKIGYFFICRHGNDVHEKYRQYLLKHNFKILASANNDETYSSDGLLVAKSASIQGGLEPVSISIKGKN